MSATRIDYVDGLRAVAVLTVLASHIGLHAPGGAPSSFYHIMEEDSHGVDLFFVLSGFCLAYPTLRKVRLGKGTDFRLVDFATKRLVRIVPPFYLESFAFLTLAVAARAPDTMRGSAFRQDSTSLSLAPRVAGFSA